MAVIKVTNSKGKINGIIDYVTRNGELDKELVSGINCSPDTVKEEMSNTKDMWDKNDGRQYIHYVQSFKPGEIEDLSKAHRIGMEWGEESFKGYEVLMVTHNDKEHIHNHFVVNSVGYEDGRKFQQTKKDLGYLKEYSNMICEKEGLSIPEKQFDMVTTFDQKKYRALEKGFKAEKDSYLVNTAKAVLKAIKTAFSKKDFIDKMEQEDYTVTWKDSRKHITFTTPEGKKVRGSNLAKTFKDKRFTKEGIENEITGNRDASRQRYPDGAEPSEGYTARDKRSCTIEGDGVPIQPSNAVVSGIQQQAREVRERTEGIIRKDVNEVQGDTDIKRDIESKQPERVAEPQPRIKQRSKSIDRGFDI